MDMSKIKKNIFWFGAVGAVAVVLILYGLFANPYRLKNSKKVESLEQVLSELERYEKKGMKTINQKWIEGKEAELDRIKEEGERNIDLFTKRDVYLEKIFGFEDGDGITDVALWKSRYIQNTGLLLDTMARCNLPVSKGKLSLMEWGNEIPTWDNIVKEQKRYWIVEELLSIMRKQELKISHIESIRFREGEVASASTGTDLYDIIPYYIKVSMDIEQILVFMHELLNSKLCFEIDTVNIDGKLNQMRMGESTTNVRNSMPGNRVHVVIEAHAIDFKT